MYAYPQFLEKYRLPSDTANDVLVETGLRQLTQHLERLDKGYLCKNKYLTGDRLTVADTFVASVLIQCEWTGFKFKMWPRVETWLKLVRSQTHWSDVHAAHKTFIRELELAQYND